MKSRQPTTDQSSIVGQTKKKRIILVLIRLDSGEIQQLNFQFEADYERDKERSIFNYWLRSISTGLIDTIKR